MIDTTFDVRADAGGKDPDTYSRTLREYHRLLWSKQLPDGRMFTLDSTVHGAYLHHDDDRGGLWLSSDSIIPTYSTSAAMRSIVSQTEAEETREFVDLAYTIGGFIIWPAHRVDGRQTLNGARGFHPRIKDRMDLTLECIRRHYVRQRSPLEATLARYGDFFELFGDFEGYVEFFLLQDLTTSKGEVRFFTSFEDFVTPALPSDLAAYHSYRRQSMSFIAARNARIQAWSGLS
ncbi:DUF6994 family protein [Aeromicrobium flavum]|nr:hypothetical protein [Aeromicrobium flavum]